jgi:phosphatidate cytidylyltransferase
VLRTRIATAVVLALALLVVLFAMPPWAGSAAFAAALLYGSYEWARFAGIHATPGRLAYLAVTGALAALAWTLARDPDWLQALLWATAAWWAIALAWMCFWPGAAPRAATLVAGQWVLVPPIVAIGHLLAGAGGTPGAALLLCMLLLVWAADIGAYFAGRAFGRLKLAPLVSPNKTWEGVLGGTLFALLIASAEARYLALPLVPYIGLGLGVVCVSIIGDLTESLFKRAAGLKDSGTLLPGHGGMLDRIDSITAAAPFYLLGLTWLGGGG